MVVLLTQKKEAQRLYTFQIDSHCEIEGNSECLEHKLQSKSAENVEVCMNAILGPEAGKLSIGPVQRVQSLRKWTWTYIRYGLSLRK